MAIKPLQSITLKNDDGEDTTYVVASAPAIVETTEPASVASFSDGAEGIPVKSLIADINPVQSGSGDPSPSNVRPITGWTGMNVYRRGINQWDEEWRLGAYSTTDGVFSADTTHLACKNPIPVMPNTSYYYNTNGKNINVCYYDADMHFVGNFNSVANVTKTTPNTCRYICFNMAQAYGTTYNNDISINYPSTDHDYHAYNGATYPISWADEAGTVYGGTLDVTTGLLTVDKASLTITSFSNVITENNGFRSYDPSLPAMSVSYGEVASNMFVRGTSYVEVTGGVKNAIGYNAAGQLLFNVWVNGAYITSKADLNTFVANNPIQIVYPLATPQTYQLTPQAVMTILGQNNIWADTGDVEVAYCADTKMYIDKVIAAL